jgi:hypothetical protein
MAADYFIMAIARVASVRGDSDVVRSFSALKRARQSARPRVDGALLRRFGYAADLLIAGVGAGNRRNDRRFRPWRQEILSPSTLREFFKLLCTAKPTSPSFRRLRSYRTRVKMPIVRDFVASSLSASPKSTAQCRQPI